ncbi:hypothetical protein PIB30_035642 [Stylosanthes scabra]|uniref:Uncharacterized protein n=1 Tax=Stylosanthes scabra TaxID=79078 RepID=A0ABU6QDN1_9FABA|nr:hypothetical protein [Stylosanthes scabra]
MGHGRDPQQVVSRAMVRWILVIAAAMVSFSNAVKFDIEKLDGRMFFGLWQVQVKDVLIQSELQKMQKVLAYKEILPWWSKFGKRLQVSASLVERYDNIL